MIVGYTIKKIYNVLKFLKPLPCVWSWQLPAVWCGEQSDPAHWWSLHRSLSNPASPGIGSWLRLAWAWLVWPLIPPSCPAPSLGAQLELGHQTVNTSVNSSEDWAIFANQLYLHVLNSLQIIQHNERNCPRPGWPVRQPDRRQVLGDHLRRARLVIQSSDTRTLT